MGFPEKLLNPGEQVAADLRPHWKFFFRPVSAVVVVGAGSLFALAKSAPRWEDFALAAALVLSLVWLALRWLRWVSTSFVVTTQRLVVRKGALRRVAREILIDRLSDISCRQSILDRLLGCGDVMVESPGRDSPEVFLDLPRPMEVQNLITRLVAQAGRGGTGEGVPNLVSHLGAQAGRGGTGEGVANLAQEYPGTGYGAGLSGTPVSVADQIAKLAELRRRGVISRREFAAKKAELLSRM